MRSKSRSTSFSQKTGYLLAGIIFWLISSFLLVKKIIGVEANMLVVFAGILFVVSIGRIIRRIFQWNS